MSPSTYSSIYWLILHCVIALAQSGDANAEKSNSTPYPSSSTDAILCWECRDSFRKAYNAASACLQKPVLFNSTHYVQCQESYRFCQVERVEVNGVIVNIRRGCADECVVGCRTSGYGITTHRCLSCCNTSLCNVGNAAVGRSAAPRIAAPPVVGALIVPMLAAGVMTCSMSGHSQPLDFIMAVLAVVAKVTKHVTVTL
ncbi:PREDICTED: uncharacterized protein LOC106811992 [Priapulus caudatus]|uniref:Uncharacterized protein LOC106811992 n=1 Tax=Priapulus caudatus TaxID=37621 RepID=A0ABM1EGA1_PRICU|nr:PREDICTED: uncharacterized protein LOC106811992 [Priapulus caudatus]